MPPHDVPGTAFLSREPPPKTIICAEEASYFEQMPRLPEASLTLPETWATVSSTSIEGHVRLSAPPGARLRQKLVAFASAGNPDPEYCDHGVRADISPLLVLLMHLSEQHSTDDDGAATSAAMATGLPACDRAGCLDTGQPSSPSGKR